MTEMGALLTLLPYVHFWPLAARLLTAEIDPYRLLAKEEAAWIAEAQPFELTKMRMPVPSQQRGS